MNSRIYLSPPSVLGDEEAAIVAALQSNWIAPLGPEVDGLEADLAEHVGVDHALALSSGTAAIHLALLAMGVSPGDIVVVPSFTFIGSVNPVVYIGAEPWFVDSEPESWNLDPDLVREAFEAARAQDRRVAAVIPVDLLGQCADYAPLEAVCEEYGVPIFEDAAEALGATYRGRAAGSFGRAAALSFNGNKIITTSGGGALVSDDEELIARCRHLSTQAREPVLHYEHHDVGYNYRMSNLLAALGRAQLATLDERVAARRALFDTYVDQLGDIDGVGFMPEAAFGTSNRWLTAVTIDPARFGATNLDIIAALDEDNIEARPVWKPMHLQPVFSGAHMFGGTVCERLFATGVCLPSGTGMTQDDISRVVSIVREVAVSTR
ncbi:MAG: aminotransferase class I/II-fold pyridoxal phosphate-dependent enzyme [Actinomycetota bacterium]